jgi:glycosyltransferase involved in cell wall biosynthesis
MATYNGERFVRSQLDSIIECLRDGDELVLVDDCSTDRTAEILREVQWANTVSIRNSSNLGVRKSFEKGLELAKGDVVFLSDQDDLWVAGKRDAFVARFEADPLCSVVISDASIIDAEGREIGPSHMRTRGGFESDVVRNFVRNRYLGCAMAIRASVLRLALPIPDSVPMHDVYLGLVGRLTGTVHYFETPYLQYRRHGGNASPSRRTGWKQVLAWRFGLMRALTQAISRPKLSYAILMFRKARRG